jgi:hypothetical protein
LLLLPLIMTILTGVRRSLSILSFDFHLFYNQGSWTLLHVFTGHLYLFLWEFPVWFIVHFFIGVLILCRLSFWIPYRFWILDSY